MFESVPAAECYTMKHILHDWDDGDFVRVLKTNRLAAREEARLFIFESLIPEPNTPHFALLMDLHMMCAAGGRERTGGGYGTLLEDAGWDHVKTREPDNPMIGAVEGRLRS